MKTSRSFRMVGFFALALYFVPANLAPQQMEKSGNSTLHSGFKGVGNVTEVDANRAHWSGVYWGHSFNDSMSGFLHNVVWNCPAAADIANGQVTFKGYCTLTDMDGDKIFGDWSGGGPAAGEVAGHVDMTGGTGKYGGITGGWDFRCRRIGTDDQLFCTQQVEHRLP